ncbi:hypothetical protein BJF88_13210 [Cellulosimicrobium sp. CUA-896]|nr:hypothetical protein BJF88_13210 [Cellulosimicrobium sp. CUA-896]
MLVVSSSVLVLAAARRAVACPVVACPIVACPIVACPTPGRTFTRRHGPGAGHVRAGYSGPTTETRAARTTRSPIR